MKKNIKKRKKTSRKISKDCEKKHVFKKLPKKKLLKTLKNSMIFDQKNLWFQRKNKIQKFPFDKNELFYLEMFDFRLLLPLRTPTSFRIFFKISLQLLYFDHFFEPWLMDSRMEQKRTISHVSLLLLASIFVHSSWPPTLYPESMNPHLLACFVLLEW